MTEALVSKTCTPCRGGVPPLMREQAELFHAQAPVTPIPIIVAQCRPFPLAAGIIIPIPVGMLPMRGPCEFAFPLHEYHDKVLASASDRSSPYGGAPLCEPWPLTEMAQPDGIKRLIFSSLWIRLRA